MNDERLSSSAYPVLFGTSRVAWAPIDMRFELLTGAVNDRLVARIYVVPFVTDRCVVIGFESGDWGPSGGGLQPEETWQAALERELAEEAGALLLSYTPFGVLHCRSHGEPYQPIYPIPISTAYTATAMSSSSVHLALGRARTLRRLSRFCLRSARSSSWLASVGGGRRTSIASRPIAGGRRRPVGAPTAEPAVQAGLPRAWSW